MLQGRKQTYGQAFGIYALAEYFRATGEPEALDRAERLFEDVETHALDPASGGYWEARGRDWGPLDDIRLSAIDMNAPFSMNTHLHILEAYTGLVLASDRPQHRERLRAVLEIMLDRIIDAGTGHVILFTGRTLAAAVRRRLLRPRDRDELAAVRGGPGAGRRCPVGPGRCGRRAAGRRRAGARLRPGRRRDLLRGVGGRQPRHGQALVGSGGGVVGFLNAYGLTGRVSSSTPRCRPGISSTPT